MDFHPIANIFPMLPPQELEDLAADIKANGLNHKITTYQNQILDGRNRFVACELAFVEPQFVEYIGTSPVQFVISENLKRRQLSPSQAAAVSLNALPFLEEEASNRREETQGRPSKLCQKIDAVNDRNIGRAAQRAADMFKTNRQYVADAKRLKEQAPELFDAVAAGEINIPEAKKEFKRQERRKIQAQEPLPQSNIIALCDDMLTIVPSLGVFDLIIADPPYNVTSWEWDKIPEFLEQTRQWLTVCKDALADNYHLFWFCSPSYAADIEMIFRELGLTIKSRLVWHRRNMSKGSDAKEKFIDTWEMIFHSGNGPLNFPLEWDSTRFDVQTFAVPQTNFTDEKLHPTQKPLELIKILVNYGSFPGGRVIVF